MAYPHVGIRDDLTPGRPLPRRHVPVFFNRHEPDPTKVVRFFRTEPLAKGCIRTRTGDALCLALRSSTPTAPIAERYGWVNRALDDDTETRPD
jgi:hypothetical protein